MSAVLEASVDAPVEAPLGKRAIVLQTRGLRHGPIARLVSPSDIGELIKPFVFLDLFDISAASAPNFGWHPHSGIATLTVVQEGAIEYEETTGAGFGKMKALDKLSTHAQCFEGANHGASID